MTKLSAGLLGAMQRDQYSHDMRNHFDILSLHKCDRLKHYGLHFCKYAGRMARGAQESKPHHRTIVDIALVMLSAANTLHQDLSRLDEGGTSGLKPNDAFLRYVDAAGRFADACEKIDHLEEFTATARSANADIAIWLLGEVEAAGVDLEGKLGIRRSELAQRHFYLA
jgi:hypothetical protein